MSVVSTIKDGKAIQEQMARFDNVSTNGFFGRLTFCVDISELSTIDANKFIDELNAIDETVNCYIEPYTSSNTDNSGVNLNFDYCITSDLIPVIRSIVNNYCLNNHGKILYWIFDDIINDF